MGRKIFVTAAEMLELRKQGMSNHDIAKSLDISLPTVLRYIGKQGGKMEGLAAFKDTSRKKEEVKEEAVIPKYEPKPIKEAFVIGDMGITLNHDSRVMYFDFAFDQAYKSIDREIPYDKIPDLVQFLAWAMRTRMEVTADAEEDKQQAEGCEV